MCEFGSGGYIVKLQIIGHQEDLETAVNGFLMWDWEDGLNVVSRLNMFTVQSWCYCSLSFSKNQEVKIKR
jgi:hypothetical protein